MLEHTLTSHTLYFLYLAHSLATVTRQALSFQLLAHPFLSPQDEEKLFIINRFRTLFRRTEGYPLLPAKNCLRNG